MILADSSAWIEFLRSTGSRSDRVVGELVEEGAALAVTDVVIMEVLAGAVDADRKHRLERLLRRFEYVQTLAPEDFVSAADLHRACRRAGETVRKLPDCLIAAVAIRAGASVLSADADFAVLARHTALQLA